MTKQILLISLTMAVTLLGSGLCGRLEAGAADTLPIVMQVSSTSSDQIGWTPPKNVREVTEEATRSNNDPIGRPLPLASHWQTGSWPYRNGNEGLTGTFIDLSYQLDLLKRGYHWLPVVNIPMFDAASDTAGYWGGGWPTFAKWRIPFTMMTAQPEDWLRAGGRPWRDLPNADNPRVILESTGELHGSLLDPLGPTKRWYELGEYWSRDHQVDEWLELKNTYPDPPKVIILSNNEANKLRHQDSDMSKRWLDTYGAGVGNLEKRETFIKAWEVLYNEMFRGIRDGFLTPTPRWSHASQFVGYGVNDRQQFARWSDWINYNDYFTNNVVYEHNFWQGGSPEMYIAPYSAMMDYLPFGPQVSHMNLKWTLDLIYADTPEYWYEFSVWDGFYGDPVNDTRYTLTDWNLVSGEYEATKPSEITGVGAVYVDDIHQALGTPGSLAAGEWAHADGTVYIKDDPAGKTVKVKQGVRDKRDIYLKAGDPYTPIRYKALIRFCMWLTKPRVVREFRGTTETQEVIGPEWLEALLEAVEEVWTDPLLKRFWRNGVSVKNTAETHPYQSNVPAEYADVERWWLLSTDLDPTRPWNILKTELPVFAQALVLGDAPNREWLVYAFSPKQNRTDVSITVPGYGDITIDVPQAGVFHHVVE